MINAQAVTWAAR